MVDSESKVRFVGMAFFGLGAGKAVSRAGQDVGLSMLGFAGMGP